MFASISGRFFAGSWVLVSALFSPARTFSFFLLALAGRPFWVSFAHGTLVVSSFFETFHSEKPLRQTNFERVSPLILRSFPFVIPSYADLGERTSWLRLSRLQAVLLFLLKNARLLVRPGSFFFSHPSLFLSAFSFRSSELFFFSAFLEFVSQWVFDADFMWRRPISFFFPRVFSLFLLISPYCQILTVP